jgi:hypothetical protein
MSVVADDAMCGTDYCPCQMYNSINLCDKCHINIIENNHHRLIIYNNLSPSLAVLICYVGKYVRITNLPYYLLCIYNSYYNTIALLGCETHNYKVCNMPYMSSFINNYNYIDVRSSFKYNSVCFDTVCYPSLTLKSITTEYHHYNDYYPASLTTIDTITIIRRTIDNLPIQLTSSIITQHSVNNAECYSYSRSCPKIVSNKNARNLPINYKAICSAHHNIKESSR